MSRAYRLLSKYGITEEQYAELLRKQRGCCAVCGRHESVFRKKLSIDHDHNSGFIRGLLCINCNRYVVGRHRKGSGSELLLAAYNYLINDYPGWIVPPKPKRKKKKCKISKKSGTRFKRGLAV